MVSHDFMTLHAARTIEYLIAVAYLLLFIPFWRYVNVTPSFAPGRERASAPGFGNVFAAPASLFYHPGHAWARVDGDQAVTVGFDDFAAKLVGPPSAIVLPDVGAVVAQGEPAWTFVVDDTRIEMLAPVDGTVVEVNERARQMPEEAHASPYETGWLLKVQSPRLATNVRQLLPGRFARQWIRSLAEDLRGHPSPALGTVCDDGGEVVDGLAQALDPDGWEDLARRYLLVDDTAGNPGGDHA
jgi:glycine cleavage system H protein